MRIPKKFSNIIFVNKFSNNNKNGDNNNSQHKEQNNKGIFGGH